MKSIPDLPTLLNPPLDFNLQTDAWISSSSICFNYAKRYQLEWKIWNADQEDDLIQAFYVKMETLWDQLSFMEPQFMCHWLCYV